MRNLIPLALLVFVVAACNLSSKLKPGNSNDASTSPSSGSSSKIGDDPVEKPNPTAAQTAAIAGGDEVKWDQQGITWTVPANWKKLDVRNETLSYGGNGAFLTVNISVLPQMENL